MYKKNLKQSILLEQSLLEAGIDFEDSEISVLHNAGKNIVNGIEMGIKYPKKYFEQSEKYHQNKKQHRFYFNGNSGNNGSRIKLLEPFTQRNDSFVFFTDEGRMMKNKHNQNINYFEGLSSSHYGLCPHQLDWPGDVSKLWTYRFIECLMVKTMPVNFRATPLCDSFVGNFAFVWDDDMITSSDTPLDSQLEKNYTLAKETFTLTDEEIRGIKWKSQ